MVKLNRIKKKYNTAVRYNNFDRRGWMFAPVLDSEEPHDESHRFRPRNCLKSAPMFMKYLRPGRTSVFYERRFDSRISGARSGITTGLLAKVGHSGLPQLSEQTGGYTFRKHGLGLDTDAA
jgi:hypothetical protein